MGVQTKKGLFCQENIANKNSVKTTPFFINLRAVLVFFFGVDKNFRQCQGLRGIEMVKVPVIFFDWKDSRKVRSPNWSDAYYINFFFLMSDIFLMTFFQVFGIWIRRISLGLSRVDAAEGDANWPGNSWNRGKFQPPPNPPDRNRIFTRLTGRPYSKRFFEILKARRKLPCEMAQNFCRFFLVFVQLFQKL